MHINMKDIIYSNSTVFAQMLDRGMKDQPTNKLTDRPTNGCTDQPTNRQTDGPTH